jgi:hypothetical protein
MAQPLALVACCSVKRILPLLTAAVACLALGGTWAIPALASAPHGTLTSHEYALLSSAEAKLGTALRKAPVSWGGARAACHAVGSSTTLLESERASCLTETQLYEGLADFPRQESSCGTSQPHYDLCVLPLYTDLARDSKALYYADTVEYQQAAQRGLTGRCFDALANTTMQLGEQRDLATTTEKLKADLQLAIKVEEGKLPSSAITASQINSDAKAFERDGHLVLDQSGPKLSVCPHQ